MYSLYALCLFGISLNQVKKLVRNGITISDFQNHTEKISDLAMHKPAVVKNITDIIPLIKQEELEDNPYQLAHKGLSLVIINNLVQLDVKYHDLHKLTLEQFNELMGGNRTSVFNKIISAFEEVEISKGRYPLRKLKGSILTIFNNLSLEESITVEEIKEKISSETPIDVSLVEINSILEDLQASNKIKHQNNGYLMSYPNIIDFLSGEFKDKDIFIRRLQGYSLAQVAEEYDYSRQGIRNIEIRVLKKMPVFEEDYRYASDFEKFDIPRDLFLKLYEEPIEVYFYLNARYKKGQKLILDDVFNTKYTENQRKFILRYYNRFLNKQGEVKEITKKTVFEEVVTKHALNSVTDAEIVEKFNEYIIKNNLPKSYLSDESSLRGISDRCQNIIRGKGNTYRYYDFDVLTKNLIESLKEQLQLSTGVYSMKKIFRENSDIMEDLDIRTEYELHNLYRRMIEVDKVIYTRMPEFKVGLITKREFLIGLFKEYSPIPLKEFVKLVEEIYGLRSDSLTSYIISNLNEYLYEENIKTDYIEMTEDERYRFVSLLTEPIYTIEELKKLCIQLGNNFDEKFINNMTLSPLGYQIKSNFVLSDRYNSIDDYFRNLILSGDYFYNEYLPLYRTQSFKAVIYNLERSFEIFKIEKDVYMTFKKLSESGITVEDILDYKRSLSEFIVEDEKKYFTLHMLREEGFNHYLDSLGFSDIFYERLICAFEGYRAVQTTTGYILKNTNSAISLKAFLYEYVSKKRVVRLEDLIDDICIIYGISLDASKVIYLLKQVDVFYSEELYKFYIDKEDFFEEHSC